MEYTRRGHWFLENRGQRQVLLGRIQFHTSKLSRSLVENDDGNVIGVFDILDSTFKPVSATEYHQTTCDPF